MIRTVLIDDEALARQRLRDFLADERDVEVVGEYSSGRSAIRELPRVKPDLLFVDIEMPRVTGLEILRFLRGHFEQAPSVVFVTAHTSYAVNAFDEGAVDYLLKPFDGLRFSMAMDRVRARRPAATSRAVADPVHSAAVSAPPRLAVRTSGGVVRLLRVEDVDWIEAAGNYVRVHSGRDGFLLRGTIQQLEESLRHFLFVRISRSTLVNIDRVIMLQRAFHRDQMLTLRDGTRLKLSGAFRSRLAPHLAGDY
jgi:two-component system LytT family response regulator